MPHLILQLALLIAAVFIIGSLVGSFARKRKAKSELVLSAPEQQVEAVKSAPEKDEHKVQVPVAAIPDETTTSEKAPVEKAAVEPVKVAQSVTDASETSNIEVAADTKAELISEPVVEELPIAEPVVVQEPEPVVEFGLPELLDAARDSKPDDFLKIKGIGPTLQRKLYALGIYHYDQIADWDADNAIWIGKKLNFRGRVEREEWVEQAAALVKLGEKERIEKAPKVTAKAATKKAAKAKPTAKAASVKAGVKRASAKTARRKTKTTVKKTT